jgi:hypothetical protein
MIGPHPARTAGTVFVVDDDPSVRRSLERLVKSAGWPFGLFRRPRSCCRRICRQPIAPASSPTSIWEHERPGAPGRAEHARARTCRSF